MSCFSAFTSSCLSVIRCDPPDLHRDRFNDVRAAVLSPGVPQDVRLRPPILLRIFGRAVEVGQAALVEPPSRVVVLAAAAFHRAVLHRTRRITAVVVHI